MSILQQMGEKLRTHAMSIDVSIHTCFSLDIGNFEFEPSYFRNCKLCAIFNIRFDLPNYSESRYVHRGIMPEGIEASELGRGECDFAGGRNTGEVMV